MVKKRVFLITLHIVPLWCAPDSYLDLAIIGGGMAGYSAAIYGGNARVATAVFVGPQAGGQLARAGVVENMPGLLPQYGYAIMEQLEQQAQRFGAQVLYDTVATIVLYNKPRARFKLTTDLGLTYYAQAIIIATGAHPRMLGIPGEAEFWGNGVSTCALCDCTFSQDKDVLIVGGGDAAIEEALQLAPYARSITFLLRGTSLRASPRMQEKLASLPAVSYRYACQVREIFGQQGRMVGVKVYDAATRKEEIIYAQGIFLALGHIPETECVRDLVSCDTAGHILLTERQQTSVEGIFAAGDVTDGRYRQAIVASGDGAKAALDAVAFLRGIG